MKKLKIFFYCLIISFVILLFASKSSPFYPFNDWVDANSFFTVGKSIAKGIVPYKDLFEQKGPILYFIFYFASMINQTSFTGVFILEVLFTSVTMFYAYLIMKLFLDDKKSFILLPIFLLLLVTSQAFTHGASCEEFMFPFQIIGLYYLIRHFKVQEISNVELFITGILAGFILLMKYTSLGFYFAFMLLIFLDDIKKKEYKKGFFSCIIFLFGMLLPFLFTLVYFGINDGIKDFIHVYFVVNITSYSDKIDIFSRFIRIISTFFEVLWKNNYIIIALVLLYPLFICKLSCNRKTKIALIILFIFSIMGSFYGLKPFDYYILPIIVFILLSLIMIFERITIKHYEIVLIINLVLCFSLSFFMTPNRSFHYQKLEDLYQYKYAKIINGESMVNMGFLDVGVYTLGNIYPSTYYFELHNFNYENYPDNMDSFKEYIKNKKTQYIVYVKKKEEKFLEEKMLKANYDMIEEDVCFFENRYLYATLWKVKK